jgi:UDP-glucose 4-epimerase
VRSAFADHLRPSVIARPFGFDARLQFLHHDDLLAVLQHATLAGVHGTFNVAGDGIVMLSQVIRRLGRPTISVPGFAMGSYARANGRRLTPDQVAFLSFGRGLDTRRMRYELEFAPRFTTAETLADFSASLKPGLLRDHPIEALEQVVAGHGGDTDG